MAKSPLAHSVHSNHSPAPLSPVQRSAPSNAKPAARSEPHSGAALAKRPGRFFSGAAAAFREGAAAPSTRQLAAQRRRPAGPGCDAAPPSGHKNSSGAGAQLLHRAERARRGHGAGAAGPALPAIHLHRGSLPAHSGSAAAGLRQPGAQHRDAASASASLRKAALGRKYSGATLGRRAGAAQLHPAAPAQPEPGTARSRSPAALLSAEPPLPLSRPRAAKHSLLQHGHGPLPGDRGGVFRL